MNLVDVEFYGRAVEAGEMDRAEAIRQLIQATQDQVVTEQQAGHAIDTWATRRQRTEQVYFALHEDLRSLEGTGDVQERFRARARDVMRNNALKWIREHRNRER